MNHSKNFNESLDPRRGSARAVVIVTALIALLAGLITAVPASAAKKAPDDFFGMFAETSEEKDFKGPGKAGFGAFRVAINWGAIQHTRNGAYDWSSADRGVYYSAKYGMRPTLVIFGSPGFVGKSRKGFVAPHRKRDLREWKDFAAAAAARYGRHGDFFEAYPKLDDYKVKTWVAWNEQNATNFWAPKPDPRDYARLLKSFSRGVRSEDRKATIVTGGMYGSPRSDDSLNAPRFLRKMYRVKGVKKHFDAVGLHPYDPTIRQVKRQIRSARKVMRKAGDRRAGIFVGELGWASSGPRRNRLVVGKRQQAKMLSKSLKLMLKKRRQWRIIGAYVYTWRDFSRETSCPWCPGAGLVKENGRKKPALRAVKKVLRSARR